MAKVLKIAAIVVGVAALAIVTGGAAVGLGLSLGTSVLGVSAGTLLLAGSVISLGASLLSPKPSAPTLPSDQTNRLSVSIDLRTGRKMAIGSTAFGTDLRDQEWSTDQAFLHRWIVSASHRVAAIREIWFDDKLAWTSVAGVQGEYAGYLVVTPVLEGSAANAINTGPRMGSSRRFTGCAYVYLRYKLTGNGSKAQSPFASAIPSRMTIIGDGMPVYDPRLDSTAGGSGPQRANDQTTWQWTSTAGRNASLGLLAYMLGWRIQNPATAAWKLAVGKGISPARINLASFITAANICDEQVAIAGGGTEPRYRADGLLSENDDLTRVADNFKAAMNGVLDDVDGQFRLTILHNDLAAPIGSLTTADVLGEFRWDQTPALQDTINVIRWSYTDPSTTSLYQMVDGPEVTIDSPDGIERSQTVPLALVQSPTQGQRLIKLRLQRALYPGSFQGTFQATAWKFQKGDVIRFSFAPLGFEQKLFRISDMTIQVDGTVPMSLREEHPDIYLAENDANAAIVGTAPTVYNPLLTPILLDLSNLNDVLNRVTSDGYLSGVEKPQAMIDKAALDADLAALVARVSALGNPSDLIASRNAAQAAIDALSAYLVGLAPAWNDPTIDTVIDGPTYRAKWTDAYTAEANFSAAVTGRPGRDAITALLSNESQTLPAAADGTIATYAGAAGDVQIFAGTADVSALFTLSVPANGNPQALTFAFTGRHYAVTGGFDANEPSASLTIRSTGSGAYTGVTIDKVFSLARSRAALDGTPPPLISLTASPSVMRYDTNGNYVGGSISFVSSRQNSTTTPTFTIFKLDGTAVYGNTAAGFAAAFPSAWSSTSPDTLTSTAANAVNQVSGAGGNGFIMEAKVDGIADRVTIAKLQDGAKGDVGAAAIGAVLTNESHTLAADFAGNVANYTGAEGDFRIYAGLADVSASFTLSTFANPQAITMVYSGQHYTATGGLDASEETAPVTIRATGSGAYAGVLVDKIFSLTKSKGGADGSPPPLITVTATPSIVRYDGTDTILPNQSVTYTAIRTNSTDTPIFSIGSADGTVGYATTAAGYAANFPGAWSSTGPDTLTHTTADVGSQLGNYGGAFTMKASVTGASDTVSVKKIRDGANGAPGIDSFTFSLSADTVHVACDYLGNPKANELPKYVTGVIFKGAADVTSASTTAIAASTGTLAADSSGTSTRLYVVTTDGTLTIAATYNGAVVGTKRLAIVRDLDNAPPSTLTGISDTLVASITSATYDGSGIASKSLVLSTSSSGKLLVTAYSSYRSPTSDRFSTLIAIAAKAQYRVVGGSTWSDAGPEVQGDTAQYFPNDGPDPGNLYLNQTVTGLSPNTNYEFRINTRVTSRQNAAGTSFDNGTQSLGQTA